MLFNDRVGCGANDVLHDQTGGDIRSLRCDQKGKDRSDERKQTAYHALRPAKVEIERENGDDQKINDDRGIQLRETPFRDYGRKRHAEVSAISRAVPSLSMRTLPAWSVSSRRAISLSIRSYSTSVSL